MPNPLTEWRREFLERRDLRKATGLPLYSYRVGAEEFDTLEELLKVGLERYMRVGTLTVIARSVPFFPALFVLYSAEWWRRRYDGSGWSWGPILVDLGVPPDSWNQQHRSTCVEQGLREWGLELTRTSGLRFLGSVAFQGGLPMQLLATARGNIGGVLTRVLRLASTGSVEVNDILGWVKSLSKDLPQAYRIDEIYVLLAEVIRTVLELKRDARLETSNSAIAAFDQFDPEWRARFPLPVEDRQAQGLIEQLIRDVAVVRLVRRARKFSVERRLAGTGQTDWEIESETVVAEYIDGQDLVEQFGIGGTEIPRFLTLRFDRGEEATEIQIRRLAGKDRYRIHRQPIVTVGPSALVHHSVSLIAPDGQVWHSEIHRGDMLSFDLPWIFESIPEQTGVFRFVRQGSGSVSSAEARLSVPMEWAVEADDGGSAVEVGVCDDRRIWNIAGTVRFEDAANRFRVRCGLADASEADLEWRGARAWNIQSDTKLAFRGFPKLVRVNEDGLVLPAGRSIAWRTPGGQWTPTPAGLFGPMEATWPADGSVILRSRMLILPDGASLRIEPGSVPSQGTIRFSDWNVVSAGIDQPDISVSTHREQDDLLVDLDFRGDGPPPEWCDLTLLWKENGGSARLRVPFPSAGGRTFDASGRVVGEAERLAVEHIHGVRMIGFRGSEFHARFDNVKRTHPDRVKGTHPRVNGL